MKTLSTQLENAVQVAVTKPAYLIEIQTSPVVRLSTNGDVTWNSQLWSAVSDIRVSSLHYDGTARQQVNLEIADQDGQYTTLFLSQNINSQGLKIWATDQGALATDINTNAVLVFDGAIGRLQFSDMPAWVTIEGVSFHTGILYAPRRMIGRETGFNHLIPSGTTIQAGATTIKLERR